MVSAGDWAAGEAAGALLDMPLSKAVARAVPARASAILSAFQLVEDRREMGFT